jgi:hypothetical protein
MTDWEKEVIAQADTDQAYKTVNLLNNALEKSGYIVVKKNNVIDGWIRVD